VNSAAKGWFTEIDALTVSADAVVRAPIVIDGLLRQEGLYDVYRPAMLCAVPCVFKTSRWVKRQLTPHELLRVFDSPIAMDISLCHDANAITALSHTATPLVISSILRNLWGQVGGSGGNSVENSDDIAIDVPQGRKYTSPHEQVSAILDSPGKGRPIILAQQALDSSAAPASTRDDTVSTTTTTEQQLLLIKRAHDIAKAVKADDAEVPVYIWDQLVLRGRENSEASAVLPLLRRFAMRMYR
jgi:hypothetical protein